MEVKESNKEESEEEYEEAKEGYPRSRARISFLWLWID
jgi:hypothetical protein